jgi:hypothetical protein
MAIGAHYTSFDYLLRELPEKGLQNGGFPVEDRGRRASFFLSIDFRFLFYLLY